MTSSEWTDVPLSCDEADRYDMNVIYDVIYCSSTLIANAGWNRSKWCSGYGKEEQRTDSINYGINGKTYGSGL